MRRYRFILEYDGSKFFGWQRQQKQHTVQQALEEQLAFFCNHPVTVHGAGRTDTGVHATGQVAHADLNYPHSAFRLMLALNHFLVRQGLSVVYCEEVAPDFHARFSAIYRAYEYKILNRYGPAVWDKKVWHVSKPLNVDAMHMAAQQLVGTHDFSSFRDSKCQGKTPLKTLSRFDIERRGDYIIANLQAPSFLHHQVRIMMGTLKEVGVGTTGVDEFINIRDAKDRTKAGLTAPPQGLTLSDVGYHV
jgi:tRNA pseudouridine38-40 synthase